MATKKSDTTEPKKVDSSATTSTNSTKSKSVPKASTPKKVNDKIEVMALRPVDKTYYNDKFYPALDEGDQYTYPKEVAEYLDTLRDVDGKKLVKIIKR